MRSRITEAALYTFLSVPLIVPSTAIAGEKEEEGMAFTDLITNVLSILDNAIIPLLVAGIAIVFMISAFKLAWSSSEEQRTLARKRVLYSLFSLFVAVSIWGIINVLANTFNFDNEVKRDIYPTVTPTEEEEENANNGEEEE